MTAKLTANPSLNLVDALWPDTSSSWARNIILAIVGSLALTISAKIAIPFYPVPLTMQTLVVLLIGITMGPRLGAATIALYLAEGAMGLPVFSGTPERGVGLFYMAGPTGGYLAGFLVAAVATGWLAEKGWDRRWSTTIMTMIIGNIIIYALGLAWLGSLFGWSSKVLASGIVPFLLGDALKIGIAALLLPAIWKQVRR